MEKQSGILIKRDVSLDATVEIATYQDTGKDITYTTYKNDKQIGWSSSIEGAIDNHSIFVRAQILKTVDENLDALKYYSGTKRERVNNSFLHDFI
jgi:hypothetical protein